MVATVSLKQIQDEFNLDVVYSTKDLKDVFVSSCDVNRPALQIIGFYDYFDNNRIQLLGKVETTFISEMTSEDRYASFEGLLSKRIPCIIITRGLEVSMEMLDCAEEYEVPILRTNDTTSNFIGALVPYLRQELAPCTTEHGVLVEVYGEGVLILGESGVGKSETAIELVKRGHRLVADDAVEIKKVSAKTLIGQAPENIRHFIEIRGVGIIDVKRIFGVGAVKDTEKIDMAIQLELWNEKKEYDRLGLENTHTNILGIEVPSLCIPVRPGRNLAIIAEVAAINNRQKKMGYNAAKALIEKHMFQSENF